MRGFFVMGLVFVWIPFILFKPHIGILVWDWISHMAPHYSAPGVRDFPFLDIIAAVTVAGFLLSSDEKKFPSHPVVYLMLLYFFWTVFTALAGYDFSQSLPKLTQFFKVILFSFLTMMMMQSPNRLRLFVGVMGLSLLFVAFKGGIFTLITGGGNRVQDAGGMMKDNNQLAMAMAMLLPLAIYFFQHPPHRLLKWPAFFGIILTAISVVGTQSRGGFAALGVTFFFLILKSRRRFSILAISIPLAIGAFYFAPDSLKNRIKSAENATEDQSFLGRVVMWKFATNVAAEHPIEGGGFDVFYTLRARELYTPFGERARAVHSIYFEVLGEHGYLGLILFLTLIYTGWFSASRAYKDFKIYKETLWLADLSNAMRIGLVAYSVGGLTVNIATFDLLYHYLIIIVMARIVGDQLVRFDLTRLEDIQILEAERKQTEKKYRYRKWS